MIPHLLVVLGAIVLIASGTVPVSAAEAPAVEWQKLLGGDSAEELFFAQQTPDGGYILLGYSASSANGDVTGINHAVDGQPADAQDVWAVKVNSTGAIEWDRLLGGGGTDVGLSVDLSADGGYFLAGYSYSSADGDVTESGHGNGDAWIVKLGGTGAIEWDRLLGGAAYDEMRSVSRTPDGGCIAAGTTSSDGTGEPGNVYHGADDAWVVKLSSTGAVQWERRYGGGRTPGGPGHDWGRAIRPTADGGYILLAASTTSADGDVSGSNHGYGSVDAWLVKLSSTGGIQWERLIGSGATDEPHSIEQTPDGGFFVFGYSSSSAINGRPSGNITATSHGEFDYWAVKVDSTGEIQWQQLLGGTGSDFGFSARQTNDGGYILLGHSSSSTSGDVTGSNRGVIDMWVVKLNDAGTIQWQKLLGGDMDEWGGRTVMQAPDGGYTLFGCSLSSASGDVTPTNHGPYGDYWLVKLSSDTGIIALPGVTESPTDTNSDGTYDDVNGNGRADFADVVLYFNQMTWIAENEPLWAFDYNANGRIDFADVVWLFNHL